MGYSAFLLLILFNANSLLEQVAGVSPLTKHRLIYQGKFLNQNRNSDTHHRVNTGLPYDQVFFALPSSQFIFKVSKPLFHTKINIAMHCIKQFNQQERVCPSLLNTTVKSSDLIVYNRSTHSATCT